MKCIKCNVREAIPDSNYCATDNPGLGTVSKLVGGHLSLNELRFELAAMEANTFVALVALNWQPDGRTMASFEHRTPGLPIPELDLLKVKTGQSRDEIIHEQRTKGYSFLLSSSVFVEGKLTDVLVFRRI